MAGQDRGIPDLRMPAPTLEPDPVFLAQLSSLAVGSASGPPAGPALGPRWRAGLAAAGVVVVLGGGAFAAGTLDHDDHIAPTPPVDRPTSPAPRTSDPDRAGVGHGDPRRQPGAG